MKKFKIKLMEIGRNKHSEEIVSPFPRQETALHFALEESKKHLASDDVFLEIIDEDLSKPTVKEIWGVYAGFRLVGKVEMRELQ